MTSPSQNATRSEIFGIQYLRGIAAFLVLIVHSDQILKQDKYFGYSYLGEIANGGNLGVDLFFVISGFIMHHITNGFSRTTDSTDFIQRRFIRIVPFMWICIPVIYVLRSSVRGGIDPVPFVRGFFLWPVGDLDPNPVWTLRHELFFYVCTFFALAFRRGYLVLIGFLLLPIPIFFLKTKLQFLDNELLFNIFNVNTNSSFAIGIFLSWLYRKRAVLHGQNIAIATVLTSPAILLVAETYFSQWTGSPPLDASTLAMSGDNLTGAVVKCLLISLICGLVVYGSLGFTNVSGPLHRLGLTIGNASYSIYLTHEMVISFVGILFSKLKLHGVAGIGGVSAILISIGFGVFIHFVIEKPLIKSLRRRFAR